MRQRKGRDERTSTLVPIVLWYALTQRQAEPCTHGHTERRESCREVTTHTCFVNVRWVRGLAFLLKILSEGRISCPVPSVEREERPQSMSDTRDWQFDLEPYLP